MTLSQLATACVWIGKNVPGRVELEPNELGIAIYADDGLTRRSVGYIRVSDGRVSIWHPKRKTSK